MAKLNLFAITAALCAIVASGQMTPAPSKASATPPAAAIRLGADDVLQIQCIHSPFQGPHRGLDVRLRILPN